MPLFGGSPNVTRMKAKRDLKGLVKALRYKNPRAKHPADYAVRGAAVRALADLHDSRSMPLLVANLSNESMSYNDHAIMFRALGTPAVDALIVALNGEDAKNRASIVYILGMLQDMHAVEPLIAVLQDTNKSMRMSAAEALGKLRDVRAVEPLIAVLKDASADVRIVVAKSLGYLKDPRAVDPLIAALEAARWDPIPDMRSSMATALGELGDTRALAPLMDLHNRTVGQRSESVAVDALAKLLHDSPEAAEAARVTATSLLTKTYARSTDRWALALEYPENWETVVEDDRQGGWMRVVALARRLSMGAVGVNVQVALFEVLQRNEGVVEIGITTDGEVMRKPRTPEEYIDKSKGELRDIFRGTQFLESKVETLHGVPAASMLYTYPNDRGSKTKEYNLTLFDPDNTYQLVFEIPEPVYEVYWPLCQAMIASFRCAAAARLAAEPAAAELAADDTALAPVQLYNRGVAQYQEGDYAAAMRSFTICTQSGAYREQAFYARSLCQKRVGQPIEIPTELDDPEAAGVRYTASNLACYLTGKGYAVVVAQDTSWYRLTFPVQGATYQVSVGSGLLGGFALTLKRQAGEQFIDIRDSGQNPTPLPSDLALLTTLAGYPADTTKVTIDLDRIPLSPLPADGLSIGQGG